MPNKARLQELTASVEQLPKKTAIIADLRKDIEWLMDAQPSPSYYQKLADVLYQMLELLEGR